MKTPKTPMVRLSEYAGSQYLTDYLHPATLKKTVKRASEAIFALGLDFDSIAFIGMSGTLIAPPIAAKLRKELVMVRKKGLKSHSNHRVEGYRDTLRYLIVDDFTSTGKTARYVQKEMKRVCPKAACVGVFQADLDYLYLDDYALYTEERLAKLKI